jgi:hypothetical protein
MKNSYIVFLFLFSVFSVAQKQTQYTLVDQQISAIPIRSTHSTAEIANYINSNFKTENDKIRAAFYWTAANISYDVPNMLVQNDDFSLQQKIENTLKTRKGVCIHYAEVFKAISNELGIKCYIIEGYTKQDGKIAALSHAWCAAKIDSKWYLFDPTWGSGYVNRGVFTKKINNSYFKVSPTKMILSHMPFDYLWQFLNAPISSNQFYEGKTQGNSANSFFDFEKEIAKYNALSEIDQAFESSKRIEKNGLSNGLIAKYYNYKREAFTIYTQNKNIEKLNTLYTNYNEAIAFLNDFIVFRFKKLRPEQSDEQLTAMIQNVKNKFKKCETDAYNVGILGTENSGSLASIKKSIATASLQTEEQSQFLKEYLGKNTLGRKIMLSKFKIQN